MTHGLGTRLLAELIGTFALIFAGVGAIAMGAELLGVALAHGLTIAIMAMALGPVSGGHFNPAVSLALFSIRKFPLSEMFSYWGAQFVGATLASLLWLLIGGSGLMNAIGYGVPEVGKVVLSSGTFAINSFGALVLEAIMTFFLVLTITTVAVRQNHVLAGLFIGLTITVDILLGGNLTGAAMNPARWFGPALVSLRGENLLQFWIYLVGPAVGAVGAAFIGMWLYDRKAQSETA